MKVTCPKCQFENQADSSRVVCARCATIIEVRMDQGFDSNGKRQTARLPFTGGGQSLGGQRFSESDVYATRIGDDFDDVLDVPIQPQSGYQAVDETPPVPVFEDVFMPSQNQDQTSPYDFPPYDKASATPIDAYGNPSARPRDPQDYIEPVEQDFVAWPVLPESQEEEEATAGSGRGGLFLRIGLIVGLFGVVSFWAYYFLGDFIAKRRAAQGRTAIPAAESSESVENSEKQASPPPETQLVPPAKEDKTSPGGDQTSPEQPLPQNSKGREQNAQTVPPPEPRPSVVKPAGPSNLQKPPPSRAAEIAERGNLTVQVGAFKDKGEADARAASLNAATSGDFLVVEADIPGKGLYYRVQKVSGFASREAALSYGNRLRARNLISEFIVKPR
jgi:cell division protein FtsN